MAEDTTKKVLEGEVKLTITGGDGQITTDTSAQCYYKNNHYYLIFEEGIGEDDQKNKVVFHSTLKISEEQVSLRRSIKNDKTGTSSIAMDMIYRRGTQNGPGHLVEYPTPYGKLLLEIRTDRLLLTEAENEVKVKIHYRLLQEDQVVSEDKIVIHASK